MPLLLFFPDIVVYRKRGVVGLTTIPSYGPVKTQRVPYALWEELREVETRQELAGFFQRHETVFRDLVTQRTSPGKAERLFQEGRIADNHEFHYLAEAAKSAILRAGGTNIMSWGYWVEDSSIAGIAFEDRNPGQRTMEVPVNGHVVEVPFSYVLRIGSAELGRLREATSMIHNMLLQPVDEQKAIGRVDYVLEQQPNGSIDFALVDIGESNLTMALTDALYQRHHGFNGTGLLSRYVRVVLGEYKQRTQRMPRTVGLALENLKMFQNMPHEFYAFEAELKKQLRRNTIEAEVGILFKDDVAAGRMEGYNLIIRCFRSPLPENAYQGPMPVMIDGTAFIPLYSKGNINRVLNGKRKTLERLVSVPRIQAFPLNGDTSSLTDRILEHAQAEGMRDIVVKPSQKSENHASTAFFYNPQNPTHRVQLEKALKRLDKEEDIKEVLVEEHRGNGAVDGFKAEVRLVCLQ